MTWILASASTHVLREGCFVCAYPWGYSSAGKHFLLQAGNGLKCLQDRSQLPSFCSPSLLSFQRRNAEGGEAAPAASHGHGPQVLALAPWDSCWVHQWHLLLAVPISKKFVWLLALLGENVNICMLYQADQASNAQQVGEEMRGDRKK